MVKHKAKHVWAFDSAYTRDVRCAVPIIIFWSLMFVDVALYVRKRVQMLIVGSGCETAAVSHPESIRFLLSNGYTKVYQERGKIGGNGSSSRSLVVFAKTGQVRKVKSLQQAKSGPGRPITSRSRKNQQRRTLYGAKRNLQKAGNALAGSFHSSFSFVLLYVFRCAAAGKTQEFSLALSNAKALNPRLVEKAFSGFEHENGSKQLMGNVASLLDTKHDGRLTTTAKLSEGFGSSKFSQMVGLDDR